MISGISLTPEFISLDEEAYLVRELSRGAKGVTSGNGLYQLRYGTPVYSKKIISNVIPEYLGVYCDRLHMTGFLPHAPKHVTVNLYTIGSSIGPHIDKIDSGKVITILSISNEATMVMSRDQLREEVVLPRRSLIQLSGEARYDWNHEVLPVSGIRYSIVFRD